MDVSFFRKLVVIFESGLAFLWATYDYIRKVSEHKPRRSAVRTDERDVQRKIAVVTGSNTGIGKQTVLELAARGVTVVMACRDLKRAESAKQDILEAVPNGKLEIMRLDLGDLASVRGFSKAFKERYDHLDLLINNAGILSPELGKTKDGFESHMGINHLGPFLLTLLLLDVVVKSENARIIGLTSTTLPLARLNVDDLMLEKQPLGFFTPYSNSKMAVALFTKKLGDILRHTGVRTYALCSGLVDTQIFRSEPVYQKLVTQSFLRVFGFNVKEGCETVLHCALSKSLAEETGRLYRFLDRWDDAYEKLDDHTAQRLWDVSERLVGLEGFANKFQSTTVQVKTSNS